MLPVERQEAILRRIEIEGLVRTLGLARDFKVTDETIRKYLEALAAARIAT
jgi:DeoR/GlpR family transcriptional regulator of sugar metabolism